VDITLTQEQIDQIKKDMLLQTEMLTDEEVNALANKLNNTINIPILSAEKEFIVFVKLIRWVDRQLYALLPNEIYKLVHDSHDGISREEAVKIRQRVSPLINKLIDIPIVSEALEEVIIGTILDLILTALIKGFKLEQKEIKR